MTQHDAIAPGCLYDQLDERSEFSRVQLYVDRQPARLPRIIRYVHEAHAAQPTPAYKFWFFECSGVMSRLPRVRTVGLAAQSHHRACRHTSNYTNFDRIETRRRRAAAAP